MIITDDHKPTSAKPYTGSVTSNLISRLERIVRTVLRVVCGLSKIQIQSVWKEFSKVIFQLLHHKLNFMHFPCIGVMVQVSAIQISKPLLNHRGSIPVWVTGNICWAFLKFENNLLEQPKKNLETGKQHSTQKQGPPSWLPENVSHHVKVFYPASCMKPQLLRLTGAVSDCSVGFRRDNKVLKHLHHFAVRVCGFFIVLF